MSSYTTTTRHDTGYAIDNFFPASTQQQQAYENYNKATMVGGTVAACPASQSNLMTYDCLPQQQHPTTVSAVIPIENLSLHHSMNNEWISPLGLGGYSEEYSQPADMNFLFAYNELVSTPNATNKDNIQYTPTASESSAASMNEEKISSANILQAQTPNKGGAEQYRRLSMMDISTIHKATEAPLNYTYNLHQPHKQQQEQQQQRIVCSSSSFMDFNSNSLFNQQQQPIMVHKERSSMPNVFIGQQHPTTVNNEYFTQQQQEKHQAASQLTWQQSNLLQKGPATASTSATTPIEDDRYDFLTNYSSSPTATNFTNTLSSSVSSPLVKTPKKRLMIEEVLHEDIPYTMPPSVVSSLSEPIPTATNNWMQQHLSRKRTKSIRASNSSHHGEEPHISSSESNAAIIENDLIDDVHQQQMIDHSQQQQQDNYVSDLMITSSSSSDPINHHHGTAASDFVDMSSNNNQVLAAMPRRQKLRYTGDNYTPKWVRYTGHLKEGYCDSCNPGKWLQLKNSAYWYHKQFYHGISSVSGKSFLKPLEQRMGKGDTIEGLCHQCHRFVPACNGKKKNNYMLWYRHAHKCHLYDKPKATASKMRKLSITSSNASISPTTSTTTTNDLASSSHNII